MSIVIPGKREFYLGAMSVLKQVFAECPLDNDLEADIDGMIKDLGAMLSMEYTVPLIYVAGQYFPSTKMHGEKAGIMHWQMHTNIEKARAVGAECVCRGWYPLIPHTNTAWMSGLQQHEWWYEATNEMLKVCDAIIMIEGWEESHGAQLEHDEAQRMGINVYYSVDEIPDIAKDDTE